MTTFITRALLQLGVVAGIVTFATIAVAGEPSSTENPPPPAAKSTNPFEAILNLFGGGNREPASQVPVGTDPKQAITKSPSPVQAIVELGEPTSTDFKPRDAKFKIFTNYAAAIREAQLSNRPLLVVLGAKWCTWCRKLEADLETKDAEAVLSGWVVVKVDVDDEPEIAQKLEASALPALRILGPWQTVVASQEGYLELAELQSWLANNRATADPAKYAILYDTAEPNDAVIEKLVAMLAETSPMARNAAVERLAAHPRAAAPAIVQILKTGRLLQQLCACDVLRRWHAPLGAIDPWRPESLQTEQFGELVDWSRKLLESGGNVETPDGQSSTGPEIDHQSVNDLLLRLMKSESNERATVIAQLLGVGPSLAAEIRARLAQAGAIDDAARESLRELLYNLLASRKLRLQEAGILAALARLDLESHRQAAGTLMEKAEVIDQPLIDELVRDSDPLIRELAIRALGRLQLLTNNDRIGQLLGDSDPNVRAAVLRVLAERPSAASVDSLCAYLRREKNEDLLVHGAKCLGQLGRNSKSMSALAHLATNKSWRVRAAAIDAVVQAIQQASQPTHVGFGAPGGTTAAMVPAELASAIVATAFEPDKFVAERAAKALPLILRGNTVDQRTLENIAQTLADHPDDMQRIVDAAHGNPRTSGGVDRSHQTFAPLVRPARQWLNQDNPKQIQRATVILGRIAPTELNDRMGTLIASGNAAVRLTALRAAMRSLEEYRRESIERATSAWASRDRGDNSRKRSAITPWYELPPTPRATAEITDSAKQPTTSERAAQSDDARQAPDTPDPVNSALDLVGGLFGSPPAKPALAAADDQPEAVNPLRNAPTDELSKIIPSKWMQRWQATRGGGDAPQWVGACIAPTEKLLASDDPAERALAHAVWLALGHTDRIEELLVLIQDRAPAMQPDTNRTLAAGTFPEIISWLPPDQAFAQSKKRLEATENNTAKIIAALAPCTLIDNVRFADWLFDYAADFPLASTESKADIAKVLLRARIGGFGGSHIDTLRLEELYTYGTEAPYRVASTKETPVPGYAEACEWLRTKYRGTTNQRLRAVALLAVNQLDHKTAVDAALGAIHEAKADNQMLAAALAIVFSDGSLVNAPRAATLLGHSSRQVRIAALQELAAPASSKASLTRSKVESDVLPGFWRTTDKLPTDAITALAATDDARQEAQARLLLLAAGEELDLADLERDLEPIAASKSKLFVAAALAKAQRTDEPAIAYYRETYAALSREAGDIRLPALYDVIRGLPGDDLSDLRRKMRTEKGAQLFEQNGSSNRSFISL